ncbi:hypothetical protein CGLAMM_00030 [Acetobacteraceae bacterium EV16G]|uniref:Enterotoxin n=1 Tax=Sorlinia euscelidii TaxID=3081148 RepID=A0ABU7U4P2_9PROT
MNVFRAAFVLLALFTGSASYALDPPGRVYRVSSRAPADVFTSGFPAEGNDLDLLRYVSGASVVDGTSAYISTTQISRHAVAFAMIFARAFPTVPVYIYLVRPTENFYSVAASMRYAQEVLPNPEVREQVSAVALATRGQENGHWAARGGISPEQIFGVRRFYWDDGSPPRLGDLIQNANYLFMPPATNHSPMPVHNATVTAAYVAEAVHSVEFLPAAVANMGCDQSPRQCRKAFASHCIPVHPISFAQLRSKTVAKMITSGILMGSTSGQLLVEPGHDEL